MEFHVVAIAILGGFAAGVINTLAGNGSAITLSILTEIIGLPGNIANATNRVGVQLQGLASSTAFLRHGKGIRKEARYLIFVASIGAILGVWAAINVSNEQFISVFKYLLIFLLFVTFVNPKKWLVKTSDAAKIHPWIAVPSFLILGFYGGFIQMGMGVVFLVVTVLVMRFNMIDANALKTYIVTIYTIVVLAIFEWRGLIQWEVGLIIAIGQMAGGYLTGEFASRSEKAELWAYRVLVLVIIWAILSTFKLI